MESVNTFLMSLTDKMGTFLPDFVGALVILFLGWLLAKALGRAASTGVDWMLGRFDLAESTTKQASSLSGKLVYYLVFLFFLVFALNSLGYGEVLAPITKMFEDLFSALPNVIAASLIGFIGFIVAKVVSALVEIAAQGLQSLAERAGVSGLNLPKVLSLVVFVLVFTPALLAAFEKLDIGVISVPATQMLSLFLAAIPKVIAAVLILTVAYFVGRYVAGALTELLQGGGADSWPEKLGIESAFESSSFSTLIGRIVLFFILLGGAVAAVEQLELPVLSNILDQMLTFTADIVVGLVILGIGSLLANMAYQALNNAGSALAGPARFAILGLVLAMGLKAMGLADDVVNLAFGLTLGALAVAFALAFGLGGRDAAGGQVQRWLDRLNSN